MDVVEKLERDFLDLPKREQAEILDFVQFVKEKKVHEKSENAAWERLSQTVAMQEVDDTEYSMDDLKEIWK